MDLSLLDLPDDALVAVLAYLSRAELLGCRVVCRRLRDLCLHRHLWKSAAIDTVKRLRALRVLPCLRKLSLVNPEGWLTVALRKKVLSLVASTECVVADLEVRAGSDYDGDVVRLATAMVKKFLALGGLRALGLQFVNLEDPSSLAPLLKAAFSVGGLRELRIDLGQTIPPNAAPWSFSEKRPSLTKLEYFGNLDPLLESLLTTHAPTLEDVSLSLSKTDHLPMNLLRMMPCLRSFACKASALLDTAALSNLNTLKFFDAPLHFSPSALDFLRQAPHLRSVSFPLPRENHTAPLQALASSPSARLVESLTVRWKSRNLDAIGVELAANILPDFPSLQSLSLECWLHGDAVDGFLQAVSPTSAPSLTSLTMKQPFHSCRHGWLHFPAVQELLERNPRLHLHVLGGNRAECRCEWCRLGCHEELRKLVNLQDFVLAAHRRMAGCPSGCRRWPL